jgi:hypothetical protein
MPGMSTFSGVMICGKAKKEGVGFSSRSLSGSHLRLSLCGRFLVARSFWVLRYGQSILVSPSGYLRVLPRSLICYLGALCSSRYVPRLHKGGCRRWLS